MSFELTGKLIEKFEITQISDTFKKREFVIERVENTSGGMEFIDQIKFQLTQDRCGIIDSMDIDDELRLFELLAEFRVLCLRLLQLLSELGIGVGFPSSLLRLQGAKLSLLSSLFPLADVGAEDSFSPKD